MKAFVYEEYGSSNVLHMKEMIEAHSVKPIIDRCFALDEIPQAMVYLETGHPYGKVVISMGQDY